MTNIKRWRKPANLLLNSAALDSIAQDILLSEVFPVFTERDNKMLEKAPDKNFVKEVLFNFILKI